MRILACGGRHYANAAHVCAVLDRFRFVADVDVLIQGEADGADALAKAWAHSRRVPVLSFHARWNCTTVPGAVIRYRRGRAYNARAGLDRNATMLREGRPDVVIAFPGGVGTAHMVQISREAGAWVETQKPPR